MNTTPITQTAAWVIDRDYDHDASKGERSGDLPSRVGRGQWGTENGPKNDAKPEMPYRFRLRYEDEEDGIAYGGRYNAEATDVEEGEWGDLYNALKFGEWDVGATILEVKADDWTALHGGPDSFTGKHVADNTKQGWYVPYG